MSDLRLKVRNKIYTSGNHIVDTKNNNNEIVVFLGEMSSENLKPYVDNFFKDTLKSQIPGSKIIYVTVEKEKMQELPQIISAAVKKISFNPTMNNELYISFVTFMDDDIFEQEQKIDVNVIEEIKVSALGGYAVEIFYDFYGIFASDAKYENRLNARKTIVNFLDEKNGGINIIKRVYHQACPGNDFYRTAKSITFMILTSLINKLEPHVVLNSRVSGNDYTWTTFSLFEKNLAALVIYEMINKLLENQVNGVETFPFEAMLQTVIDEVSDIEDKMKKIASANDINFIPITVHRVERNLTFAEMARNAFSRQKIRPVDYRLENEEQSVLDLLSQQSRALKAFIDENITESYIDGFILKLINKCTFMGSINNSRNEAMILKSLESVRSDIVANASSGYASYEVNSSADYYYPKYNKLLSDIKINILDRIIEHFKNNVSEYVERVQKHWNEMNMEVSGMINDFATFHDYFEGIGDLITDKTVPLMCSFDDMLEKIDVRSVIATIDRNTEIFSNVLASYYDNVQAAGDIVRRFGNRNIVPNYENISYCLYSNKPVACPGRLKSVVDEYWFKEHEIAILFTAKNNITDCNNLPFSV